MNFMYYKILWHLLLLCFSGLSLLIFVTFLGMVRSRTIKLLALANNAPVKRPTTPHGQCNYTSHIENISKLEHENHETETKKWNNNNNNNKVGMGMNWVPHPKSGIYFPEGQDWVMNDVPCNAATLGQTQPYWLRNIDGVDKYDPDVSSADQYLLVANHANA
ncbi:hypothetical protein KSS87_022129 [Heliosperma pusillum]|nr:hypothetical protein KSS87_022129 [Heliosperma pusillum]